MNEISGTRGRIPEGLTIMQTESQKDGRNRVVIQKKVNHVTIHSKGPHACMSSSQVRYEQELAAKKVKVY